MDVPDPEPVDKRKSLPPSSPGAILMRGFAFVLLTWALAWWWFGMATASGRRCQDKPTFTDHAQLRSIARRLTPERAMAMGEIFPEGRLFSWSFYGFALVNMATALPDDEDFRQHALDELERLIPIVEGLAAEPPFYGRDDEFPKGGVIPAGHANLLRAGYAILGGRREDIINEYHRQSDALCAAFLDTEVGSLDSYLNLIWPVDNCCALESLRLHDTLYGSDYAAACRHWEAWLCDNLDDECGMAPAQISRDGATVDGPRGCALSWSMAFMPSIAPKLCREQYARYRDEWFVHVLGMTGAREWAEGREGVMDADTGPVIAGAGAAASGFAIAAARANGDWENLGRMLRGVELLGCPAWTWRGEKRYFCGRLILAEVLALWARTVRPWDGDVEPVEWPDGKHSGFWIVLLVSGALVAAFVVSGGRWMIREWRAMTANGRKWSRLSVVVLFVHGFFLAVWLILPIGWPAAIVAMFVVDVAERFCQRALAA